MRAGLPWGAGGGPSSHSEPPRLFLAEPGEASFNKRATFCQSACRGFRRSANHTGKLPAITSEKETGRHFYRTLSFYLRGTVTA